MKKLLCVLVLLLAVQSTQAEVLPKPSVLFNITEKILAHMQEFLFVTVDKPVKPAKLKPAVRVKTKDLSVPAESVPPAKPGEAPKAPKVKCDGMWIVTE